MEVRAFLWTTRDGLDVCIDIVADYTEATADVHYLPNGDPGHPGNPESVEITSATIDGADAGLDADETEKAVEAVIGAAAYDYFYGDE